MDDYFDRFPDSYVESSRRRIQTPSAFARSAFFYVQETGYLKLRESHVARRKNLESYLVVLVLSGSGILMYGQKTYELKKGSCFFIDCMVPYYHQSSSADPWELVWVHFNGCTSEEYYRYFSSNSLPAFSPPSFPELREKLESLLDVNSVSDFQAEITSSRLIAVPGISPVLQCHAGTICYLPPSDQGKKASSLFGLYSGGNRPFLRVLRRQLSEPPVPEVGRYQRLGIPAEVDQLGGK